MLYDSQLGKAMQRELHVHIKQTFPPLVLMINTHVAFLSAAGFAQMNF